MDFNGNDVHPVVLFFGMLLCFMLFLGSLGGLISWEMRILMGNVEWWEKALWFLSASVFLTLLALLNAAGNDDSEKKIEK